jgi:hypothetical protein
MRSAARATAIVLALGLVVFVVLGLVKRSDDAFTLGAAAGGVAVQLAPEQEACQGPIAVPDGGAFDGAEQPVGTYGQPGPELRVTLRDANGRAVARHTLRAGYRDGSTVEIPFGRRIDRQGLVLCFENRGRTDAGLYGTGGNPVVDSALRVDDGDDTQADLALTFTRPSRSVLAAAPDVFDRATLFRSPRLPAILFAIVLLALVVGAGWTLVAAMRAADPDGTPTPVPADPFAGGPRPRTMAEREDDGDGAGDDGDGAGDDDPPADAGATRL